jgi:transcription elongation factor GreA
LTFTAGGSGLFFPFFPWRRQASTGKNALIKVGWSMSTKTKPHLLTPEGLQRLKEELRYLRTDGRERIAERLENAFADGQDDEFVDNAELEAARNEQSFLEGRIMELEEILGNYQLIEENGPHDSIRVGDWVTVIEEGFDEEERYHLVGAAEADPAQGRISNESPLGKALLGAKVKDVVSVNAPNGVINFRITKIE